MKTSSLYHLSHLPPISIFKEGNPLPSNICYIFFKGHHLHSNRLEIESVSPKIFRKTQQKITPDFFKDWSLNQLDLENFISLSVHQYLSFLSNQPIKEQLEFIAKYIGWYLKKSDSSFLTSQINSQTDFLYKTIVISPNCQKFLTLGHDRIIHIRDFKTKYLLFHLDQTSATGDFQFSFDSSRVAYFDSFKISIWDINYLREIFEIKGKYSCFTFSKQGFFLAIAGLKDYCLEVFNEEIKLFPEPLKVASKAITSLDFSFDSDRICVGSLDCTITIWSISTRSLLQKNSSGTSFITTAIFSSKETHILAGTDDCRVVIWDISTPFGKTQKLTGHKMAIAHILCSTDQKRFVTISVGHNMLIWDFEKTVVINDLANKYVVTSIRACGDRFFTSGMDNTFLTWEFETGKVLDAPELFYGEGEGKDEFETKYAYSCDGAIIAKYHANPTNLISYWSSFTGKIIRKTAIPTIMEVSHMVFSENGEFLAVSFDNFAMVYDMKNPEKMVMGPWESGSLSKEDFKTIFKKKSSIFLEKDIVSHRIKHLNFLNSSVLCAGEESGAITLWSNIANGDVKVRIAKEHNSSVTAVHQSTDESLLVTGSAWGSIRVWDYKTLKIKMATLEKHKAPIKCLIFMDLGKKIVSGCEKGLLILWKLKDLELSMIFPNPPKSDIIPKFLSLTEKDEFLIVGYENGEIIVWNFTGNAGSPQLLYFYETFNKRLLKAELKLLETESAILIAYSVNQKKSLKLWGIHSTKTFAIKNAKEATYDGQRIFSVFSLDEGSPSRRTLMSNILKSKRSFKILISDGNNGKGLFELEGHISEVLFLKASNDNKVLLSGDEGGVLYLWDIATGKILQGPLQIENRAKTGSFTDNGSVFAIGEGEGFFSIWDTLMGRRKIRVKGHEGEVICLDYLEKEGEEPLWASGGVDLKVLIWDATILIVLYSFKEVFEDCIYNVRFWDDRVFIAGRDYNREEIKCWDLKTREFKQRTLLNCQNMCLVKGFDKIISYFHDQKNLYYFMILDKEFIETDQTIIVESPISKEEGEVPLQSKWVNNHDMMCFFDNRVVIYRHFFKNENLFLKRMTEICDFCKRYNDQRFDGKLEYICSGETGIVFPFMYNLLQALAYTDDTSDELNLFEIIFEILEVKKKNINLEAFFEKDIHGRNIFDTIFYKKNAELLKSLIDYIIETYPVIETEEMAILLQYFNVKKLNEMLDLFENDPSTMGNLMNYMFSKPINYPMNFVYKSLEFPALTMTKEPKVNTLRLEELLKKIYSGNTGNKYVGKEIVEAKCLYLHELLDKSNVETKKFFKKVSNYEPTDKLFGNYTLVKLLEYKWNAYGKKLFFREGYIFLLFLMFFLTNSTYILQSRIDENSKSIEENTYIQISIALDIVLLIYLTYYIFVEISQCLYFSAKDYFKNIWNNIDMILIILSVPAVIIDLLQCFSIITDFDLLKVMNSLTIFFGFLRLISYARGIDGSAFMVRLIIQVIIDMKYFLLFLYIFIIGLGFAGYEMQMLFTYGHFEAFNTFFTAMLGDTSLLNDMTPDNYYVFYFFYIVSSIILTVTLLNLLISIISETFGKVRNNEKWTRVYERWCIVTEIDVTLSEEAQDDERGYLLYIYNESHENEDQDQMESILQKTQEYQKCGDRMIKDLKEFTGEINKELKENRLWLHDNFKKFAEEERRRNIA